MMLPKIISFSRTRGAPVLQITQQRCVDRIVQCHRLVSTTMSSPTVSFDLRGTTAGQAYPGKNHIRLNGQLLNENIDDFIEQTVGHEWAHLAAIHLYGQKIRSHGPEWKRVMTTLGLDSTRCHTYATKKARTVKSKAAPHSWLVAKVQTVVRPTGTPVLPPKMKIVAPPLAIIEIRIPGSVSVSVVMWSYAKNLAIKKNMPLPDGLQHNQAMLTQWIGIAKRR